LIINEHELVVPKLERVLKKSIEDVNNKKN